MTKRVVGVLGFVLLLGCGGDDEGGTEVKSGLPAGSTLSSLDREDAEQLCMSMAEGFNNMLSDDEVKKISCVVLAAPLSIKVNPSTNAIEGDVAKCKELVNRCMSGEKISEGEPAFVVEEEFVDADMCMSDAVTTNFEGCEASVGEFENCANGMLGALSARFDVFDCETLRDPEKLMNMDSTDLEIQSQPRCEALYQKCPNISFGSAEEDEEG